MKRKFLSLCLALLATMLAWAQSGETVFYLSPSGDDAAQGTQSSPWRTPEAAAGQVRAFMQAHPGQAVRLEFTAGIYQIREPLVFEGLSAALTLHGPEAVLCGEMPVTGWTPVTDPSVLSRMPAAAAGKVLQADLRACGVSDLGTATERTDRIDLYCGGVRQTLARWPDNGFTQAGRAVGQTTLPDTWIRVPGTAEGRLEYLDDRMERWAHEPDPWLFGYWYWDWADKYHRLAAVDSRRREFAVDEPWSRYGYRDSCRFYGINLLCELDAPGEYYIDRDKGMIYWIVPEGGSKDGTVVSVFDGPAMIAAKDC